VAFGAVSLSVEPKLLGLLLAYFAFTSAFPYMTGVRRAKTWRSQLLARRQNWLGEEQEILLAPTESHYVARLNALIVAMEEEDRAFREKNGLADLDKLLTDPQPAKGMALVVQAFRETRDLDPRFNYLDWLAELRQKNHEIVENLEQLTAELRRQHAGKRWALVLQRRRRGLAETMKSIEAEKAPVWVGFGIIATALVSGILGELAKTLWQIFAGTAPK